MGDDGIGSSLVKMMRDKKNDVGSRFNFAVLLTIDSYKEK